jgi:hypothetical protein
MTGVRATAGEDGLASRVLRWVAPKANKDNAINTKMAPINFISTTSRNA